MGRKYAEIAFTDRVKSIQERQGSRRSYAKMEGREDFNGNLSEVEARFIEERDSFYMASVNTTGWPYVQHRGGPPGFMKVLDGRTLGFADFRGNRQYVTVGNLEDDNRVSLFFMDYVNQRRLKVFARATVTNDPEILKQLAVGDYRGRVERGILIEIEGFDWNCQQHITPRYTEADVSGMVSSSQTSCVQHPQPNSAVLDTAQRCAV